MIGKSRCVRSDRSGATLTEFGLIAPVVLLMLMGAFDLLHQAYVRAVLQGAIQKAGRDSSLERGAAADSNAAMDAVIVDQVRRLTGDGLTYDSDRLSYTDFSKVGQAERFVDASPGNNRYDMGECFEDENGNNQWDSDKGRSGQGGAQDAVLYEITVTYPRLFPMSGLLGWSTNQVVSATTVLRNQPYGTQVRPTVTPCT